MKIRTGLYRIGNFRIENNPNPEYEKSKPWLIIDESEIVENPIGRVRTLKEAIKMVEKINEIN